jgi:hypothetical protein
MSGIMEMERTLRERPLLVASDLASASIILRYAQRHGIASAQLDDLRARVLSAMSTLQLAQHADGSFAYWRNGASSPYVTAWALEGMLEAMELDLPLPQDSLKRASAYLIKSHEADALVSTDEIAFWEGDGAKVRLGISAEIFDILARVPVSMRSDEHRAYLKTQGARFKEYLGANTLDPLTAGRVISALVRIEALPVIEAKATIDTLRAVRDRAHWEPSWFHAYGGRVEATTAMIGAMVATDPVGYAVEIRDAMNWVLSTRDAWGQWHNERGTTSALRALLLLPPAAQASDGELIVTLDGREIKRVALSAADPFMSAPELGHLTLASALTPGDHEVTVRYTGKMDIPLQLFARTWSEAPAARATQGGHELAARARPSLNITQTESLVIDLSMAAGHKPATLRIAPGSLLDVDLAALGALVERTPALVDWHVSQGEVIVELDGKLDKIAIELPMIAVRSGTGVWPTVSLQEMGGAPGAQALMVSAGPITVK